MAHVGGGVLGLFVLGSGVRWGGTPFGLGAESQFLAGPFPEGWNPIWAWGGIPVFGWAPPGNGHVHIGVRGISKQMRKGVVDLIDSLYLQALCI